MGGIIEDGKAGINIQEWRQRGRRKLQRSGGVSHRQPNRFQENSTHENSTQQ